MKKVLFLIAIFSIVTFAQNYLPLHLGNKYQFLFDYQTISSGTSWWESDIYTSQITKDTVINGTRYFNFGGLQRYDSLQNKIFYYCGGQDSLLIDFNSTVDFPVNKCFSSYPSTQATHQTSNGSYFGKSLSLSGFTFNDGHGYRDYYWGPDLGMVKSWVSYHSGGNYETNKFTTLIESIIYTNDSCIHNTYGYKANITLLQNDLDLNKLKFYLMVNHNFTKVSPKFTYIDKVYLNGFYKKDNDIIPIDSLIFSYPGTDTRLFKIDLPLDTFYLNNGYTFYYKAIAKDKGLIPIYTSYPDTGYLSKTILSVNDKKELVTNFNLSQNYPNPFNPTTNISYYIPSESKVNITVYNALGSKIKELVSENKPQGNYEVKFDGAGLASGVYFVTLKAASVDGKQSFVSSKKMILMK